MEKLRIVAKDTCRALRTLKEITRQPYSLIVRDAAIQRFEYSFEIFWKFLKEYLKFEDGIICASPKSCFREAFK
jgi:nucleotidyltransferase substrate binding protein (TIGR01987 family)